MTEQQNEAPKQKLPVPVHPETGKPIKIIDANCEFCGVSAAKCEHTQAFRDNGLLQKSQAMKEEAKIYRNFDGLPDVIPQRLGGICEFCGVDANKCVHAEERRERAKTAPEQSRKRTEVDRATGAKVHIKEPENQETTERRNS